MRKLFFILLMSILLLTACNNNNAPNEPPKNNGELKIENVFPIKENTKYSYEGEGNEFATYTMYIDYINGDRIQTRTNNGGSEVVRVLELKNGQLTELFLRGETYFRENFTDETFETGKILLKEPLKEGTSWSNGENSTSTITSASKEVVTTQGNVNAIEVTTKNSQGTTIEYYAKDKGLVKTINKGEGYEVSSTLSQIENNVPLIQTVTLFYPDIDGINYNTIDVPVTFNTNDEPKDVIEQTVKDLSAYNIFSANTKINELYYRLEDNSVHIDLSENFVTDMSAGAGFEMMILTSIANTLGTYYGVQEVYLTIDGNPYESGHILLNEGESLTVDYSNIKTQ